MRILLLSGSPRRQGNTVRILAQLAQKLEAQGHQVTPLSLADYTLKGCNGCSVCQGKLEEPGCVQTDDIAALLRQVLAADAVVYGTPLYGHSFSGQMKLFLDRHVALFKFVGGEDKAVGEMEILSFLRDKPVALVVSCQGPKEENTELISMQFSLFCQSSLARDLGTFVFPWCDPRVTGSHYDPATLDRLVQALTQG